MRPPSPHELLPVEHNLALIPTLISDGDPTVLCRVKRKGCSKRNSMKRKLLKRNEMLYLVLRSQPRHRPPDLSDRKGGSALHTMSPLYPPAAHGELLPVEHNLALIPALVTDADLTVFCRVKRKAHDFGNGRVGK